MATTVVNNFSGGIADHYLSAPPNSCKALHNFLLGDDAKPTVRPAWKSFSTRCPTSSANTRISGIYIEANPYNLPVLFRGESVYRTNADNSFTEIFGPEGNFATPGKSADGFESCFVWSKQLIYCGDTTNVLPSRIYCSTFGEPADFLALTLGLPALASTPTLAGNSNSNNYVYAYYYSYTFTDYQGIEYEERGPITFASIANVDDPSVNDITSSAIPVIVNSTYTNYDVDSIKLNVFRTVNNGSSFFFTGQIDNGTTTYVDSVSDADIQNNASLYTDGGLLDWNPPLAGSLFHTVANDFHWFATERILYHSIQGAPGACPDEYQLNTEQPVRALANILSYPILFCDRSVYRVEGVFDEFGDGGYELKEISKVAGCVSHRSVISVPGGLAWAGNGGFFFTDGYQVTKISQHLNISYQTWRNDSVCATFDSAGNRVYWTINSSSNSSVSPNDFLAVFHLNMGLTPMSTFTTLGSANNIYPNCVAYTESLDAPASFRNKLLIGDASGYLMLAEDLSYADDKINSDLFISQFTKTAVLYRYESAGMDLGTDAIRSWVTQITTELDNQTDIACQYLSRRDDGGPWAPLSEIRVDGAILWNIAEYPWGEDDSDTLLHDWDSQSIVEARRGFPKGTLRSTRRQVSLLNAKTWIAKSDTAGTATTDVSLKTITLDDVSQVWPDDCEDYEVAFESDSYTYGYKVKTRVSDTVVLVYDPYGTLPDGFGLAWQMRGYRKFERLSLLSYTIHFDDDGNTQAPSRGDAAYQNA